MIQHIPRKHSQKCAVCNRKKEKRTLGLITQLQLSLIALKDVSLALEEADNFTNLSRRDLSVQFALNGFNSGSLAGPLLEYAVYHSLVLGPARVAAFARIKRCHGFSSGVSIGTVHAAVHHGSESTR